MYYKVIYNGKVIDVLEQLDYLKYQKAHDRMIRCKKNEAQAILSSNEENIWHVEGMYDIPVQGYDTVTLEPIDLYEYRQLKLFNCRTPEELLDEYTMLLLEEGMI